MYFVMSAEDVDGHNEPFLHAICETEEEAKEVVAKVAKSLDIDIEPGTNDGEKWEDERWDEDGLTVWDSRDGTCNKCVMAKYFDMTKLEMCI